MSHTNELQLIENDGWDERILVCSNGRLVKTFIIVFFGLFGVMERFSTFIGPLVFALAVATFGSSRPAVLAVIAFFIVGGLLLTRVDVAAGHAVAQADDAAEWGAGSA
jgi:hypothetical protein